MIPYSVPEYEDTEKAGDENGKTFTASKRMATMLLINLMTILKNIRNVDKRHHRRIEMWRPRRPEFSGHSFIFQGIHGTEA